MTKLQFWNLNEYHNCENSEELNYNFEIMNKKTKNKKIKVKIRVYDTNLTLIWGKLIIQ